VLQDVCQKCHIKPITKNGAPFPLVTRSDVLSTYQTVIIRDLMIQVLNARQMPLPPITITDSQRDVLLAWLGAGAPAVSPQTASSTQAPTAPS
jgi:uncharacterized membrane protein